ncbi:MAG: hypothetical protein EHM19_05875 [Candidatus Latescibacterota bacterium]|nr:MAG: hypothetical protein EHM19_05875 [Candidatus Latescibacterota bacterium]
MAKREKREKHEKTRPAREEAPARPESRPGDAVDEIDFPTVVWSLVILAVLVILHRLIWGG